MQVLTTKVDPRSEEYRANRVSMEAKLAEFESLMEQARQGGGEKYVARHRERGRRGESHEEYGQQTYAK